MLEHHHAYYLRLREHRIEILNDPSPAVRQERG